jgi:hypothetical protein
MREEDSQVVKGEMKMGGTALNSGHDRWASFSSAVTRCAFKITTFVSKTYMPSAGPFITHPPLVLKAVFGKVFQDTAVFLQGVNPCFKHFGKPRLRLSPRLLLQFLDGGGRFRPIDAARFLKAKGGARLEGIRQRHFNNAWSLR